MIMRLRYVHLCLFVVVVFFKKGLKVHEKNNVLITHKHFLNLLRKSYDPLFINQKGNPGSDFSPSILSTFHSGQAEGQGGQALITGRLQPLRPPSCAPLIPSQRLEILINAC